MRRAVGIITLAIICSLAMPGRAAQITEVRDSFEKDHPFGMALNIRYQYLSNTAKILREHSTSDSIQLLNQLQSTRTRHIMHFDIAIGLYKDLELVVNLPLVLKDQGNLDFHPDVLAAASSEGKDPRTYGYLHELDPSAQAWNYTDPGTGTMPYASNTIMDLPYGGRKRSGLDNIGIGLRWAPWSYTRDKMYPTWVLGVMFRIPTAAVRKADNDAVGDGLF